MRLHHTWVLVALGACAADDPGDAGRSITQHLELHGPWHAELRDPQARFYETYLAEVESFLGIKLPHLSLYETDWPRDCAAPYCVRGDTIMVLCHDLRRECMLGLSAAVVDQLHEMPLILRDGLTDALAGGLGHGDVLDDPIARDGVNLTAMFDDSAYRAAKQAAFQIEFGDLTWLQGTIYPAGDFVRYVFDRLGAADAMHLLANGRDPVAWQAWGGVDAVIAGWRASAQRHGRAYRFALAECSASYAISTGSTRLPVMIQGVTFAPDLLNSIDRFGIGNFDVPSDAQVTLTVSSAFQGHPFLRLEACDGTDVDQLATTFLDATTVLGTTTVHRGRYFVLAGSDRVPTPTLDEATQAEPLGIAVVPQRDVMQGRP